MKSLYQKRPRLKERWWWAIAAGLALYVFWSVSPVVWFMRPEPGSWCRGGTFVQTRLHGAKVKDWAPVPGTISARASFGPSAEDVLFEFVNDLTPASSKPRGLSEDFGVWRWYASTAHSVQMTMRHGDPDSIRVIDAPTGQVVYFERTVPSVYGFYDVPEELPECDG